MSKVEQLGAEIVKLSPAEQQQLRDMLDDIVEDRLEFTDEFRGKIEQSERDMAAGRPGRVPAGPSRRRAWFQSNERLS